MSEKRLLIHERFLAFQGEGVHMGRSAYFIRTFGCPVKCPWCDSAGTWHHNFTPKDVEKAALVTLIDACINSEAEIVVLTGGEPCVQNLKPLVNQLGAAEIPVHVETCGAFDNDADFDWVTVSPKWDMPPCDVMMHRADEFKIIVEDENTIRRWVEHFMNAGLEFPDPSRPVWLHPEWGQRDNRKVLHSICEWVKQYGAPFRAGWQLHKLYQVDAMDNQSRPPVPLGGNVERGF